MQPDARRSELHGWFEAHAEFLYCWLRARLNPRVRRDLDAEDLLQEVWVRAAKVAPGERIDNPRGWLMTIASYVFLEAVRGWQHRARTGELPASTSPSEVPDDVTSLTRRIARDELRQRFFGELDGLADEERQLLVQHGLEARPMAQVAEQLGLSTDAGHKRWQRLRDRLRSMGSPADLL